MLNYQRVDGSFYITVQWMLTLQGLGSIHENVDVVEIHWDLTKR